MKRSFIVKLQKNACKRLLGIFLVVILGVLTACDGSVATVSERPTDYEGMMQQWKQESTGESAVCWYTNEADKKWLETASKAFEKQFGKKIQCIYYDGASFFDDLNQANQNGSGPDLYIMGNDQIELARNGGMAEVNDAFSEQFWDEYYPTVAKKAMTYGEKQYGYPIYFDTYCLVYDAALLQNAPASIDDILAFLDEYEDTGSTKAIFRWDVADPYVNSMFYAAYAELFGENGDTSTAFKVNDEKSIAAMTYFQSLSAYLWMDKNNISHDTVMNRIKDETLVLGLCKSDILPTLYEMQKAKTDTTEAMENEESSSEAVANYQISYVPSLTSELSSGVFSTTYGAFVNPNANDAALANMFALYLSYGYADQQFVGNGKLPVISQKDQFDDLQSVIYAQYQNSIPIPKVMVLGDYLAQSAIAFDAIWDGKDVTEQLNQLQSAMDEKIK